MPDELAVRTENLLDWLLARRAIPADYSRLLTGMEAKISQALEAEIEDPSLVAFLDERKEALHYMAVREVYDRFADSPLGAARTFLGGHAHPGVAKWKAVRDAFKRKNLGWASVARVLVQHVTYDIPVLKKQEAACEKQLADCRHRRTELQRLERNAKSSLCEMLAELGIEGVDPARELQLRADAALPEVYRDVGGAVAEVWSNVVTYYQDFSEHLSGRPAEPVLPLLRLIGSLGLDVTLEAAESEVLALALCREQLGLPEAQLRGWPAQPEATGPVLEVTGAEDAMGISWDVEQRARISELLAKPYNKHAFRCVFKGGGSKFVEETKVLAESIISVDNNTNFFENTRLPV
eukprot:TRINITY_DN5702_c0_g1_i1.p1 TRINITY_DN5702_c0_g1~~TRINITY_DN5702_c0_g1_i1.p1  ORF type:complete len:351 (+),score=75.48 TRINITY_DN5702_c0_g1_i1:93-1145(+)